MSTGLTWQTTSTGLEATLKIAEKIGRRLRGGEVIELVSDLGGGKTAFVRGLAIGIESRDQVRSPSFTLSNEYRGEDLTLYHFDFYRLSEPGIMRQELEEVLQRADAIIAVEWAGVVENVLPSGRLTVHIKATGETERQFSFAYPTGLAYLFEVTGNE